MSRSWTVDSIEEGIAAVQEEDGRMLHLPAWLLPDGAAKATWWRSTASPLPASLTLRLRIDRAATERALAASREQLARLRQGGRWGRGDPAVRG
jgi:hypothetical protein